MVKSSANQEKNLVLILDGNSVLHRAYYALPDWRNRSGEATAGVYGFLSMMLKALEELKPTHLAVVFDHPSPTFRHTMYVGYQTNREKERQVSEDIWGQIEKLKVVLEKMGILVYQVAGFEADDVIGTISAQIKDKSAQVIIITGDRDLMQLVDKRIKLYMPIKGLSDTVIVDEDKVMERMGVHPKQIIDYKALVGDSSDNYPGVAGIGPKTATALLAEYGTFEKIYEFIKISPRTPLLNSGEGVMKKLIDGYEGGELSKRLATIRTDAPVSYDSAQCTAPSPQKLTEVLQELGYKSLIKRMGGKADESSSRPRLFE
ncbi:MAG: polymerase protein [Candidatus Amesbacteria bacterium GW2011_GWA2_47_11b]|uniref:Polymerase protein n=3 Tax=Candidatus Amesiibacteriota TaxID=1752730 RepID=A0A0G1SJW2_9BACT|nr:MAG: polymerase protein [Microgenomates group bacterium GW2011_GWC1_46_20]KKU57144.1 MAG: polymerase protein [Candidatus Amesbacteria bacterium GW2011_GWA2_47_11b]KKU69701.1 MAG: polymerase protein [Candidatus Amesbacteria bacterium GW2011_GWA1_47_20]KKU83304.1 MAG: polymerase protein [Candidatus Amesbacteria bacterium GW2011_GWC2_47_8]